MFDAEGTGVSDLEVLTGKVNYLSSTEWSQRDPSSDPSGVTSASFGSVGM